MCRQICSAVHRKEAAGLRISLTPQMQVQTPWPASGALGRYWGAPGDSWAGRGGDESFGWPCRICCWGQCGGLGVGLVRSDWEFSVIAKAHNVEGDLPAPGVITAFEAEVNCPGLETRRWGLYQPLLLLGPPSPSSPLTAFLGTWLLQALKHL